MRLINLSIMVLLFLLSPIVVSNTIDNTTISYDMILYNTTIDGILVGDRGWGWWWPEFPGKFEPFFDLRYDIDNSTTSCMAEMDGIGVADFNGDGYLDFAVSWREVTDTSFGSWIGLFFNDNGSGFHGFKKIFYLTNYFISDLDAADYDNDGDIDLLYTYSEYIWYNGLPWNVNGTGCILFNDGYNNFSNPQRVFWHGPGIPGESDNRINPQVTSNDFDGDGDIDFLVGDNTGLVAFYSNNGDGSFTWVCDSDFGYPLGVSWGLDSGDYDNDGDIDFIVTEFIDPAEGFVYLKYNDGSSSCFNHSNYKRIASIPDDRNMSFYANLNFAAFGFLRTIDYNLDGYLDFIYGAMGDILLYIQTSEGVFKQFTVCRFPSSNPDHDGCFYQVSFRMGGVGIGDFNKDGLDDLILGGSDFVIETMYNTCNLVDLVFPDKCTLIINNKTPYFVGDFLPFYYLLKYSISIVVGGIDIVAEELSPLSKVEFYVDDNLVYVDTSKPFIYHLRPHPGLHKLKVIGYIGDEAVGYDESLIMEL